MSTELHLKYRPKDFSEVIGQKSAVRVLEAKLKKKELPHAIIFAGPSGCGKTTLARILKTKLKCGNSDFNELNCADIRGIENIRDIRKMIPLAPMGGKCRIWLIDEAHKLTNDAQNAMLTMLENAPAHVYFMLATSEPGKIIKAIHTRCFPISIKPLSDNDLGLLVVSISDKHHEVQDSIDDEVVHKIVEAANGSARSALVFLEMIQEFDTPDEQIDAIEKADSRRDAIEICRALVNPKTRWPDMVKILKEVDTTEPEKLRHLVLAYATSCLLTGNTKIHSKSQLILQVFRDHWYDCGKAGLISCCYEVLQTK